MPTREFTQARELLDEIESRWISLFLWLSASTGVSPEALVAELGEDGTDALANYETRRRAAPTGQFTPLHFLQFPFYVALARRFRNELAALGNPPANWTRQLGQQNNRAVSFRNDLQHAGRFDLLPPADRQTAVNVFREQLQALQEWWPNHSYRPQEPMLERNPRRAALQILSRDERSAVALAEVLGFERIQNPTNLLAPGAQNAAATALGDDFGRLFRVGGKRLGHTSVGLYLAYLGEWPERSAGRERHRRRLARALTTLNLDGRFLVVMLDDREGTGDARTSEIEIVYPRQRPGRPFGTVRAVIDRDRPTRYHLELLEALNIAAGVTSVQQVTIRWNEAFNVERVTNAFYREFKALRDQIGRASLEHNPDHPVLVLQ